VPTQTNPHRSAHQLANLALFGFNKLSSEATATKLNDSLLILNEEGSEFNPVFIEI
jgi:hypothetical protein